MLTNVKHVVKIIDPLACYRTLTLELFENLREVSDKLYVKLGEDEFKSKVKPRSNFFSFFCNDETDQKLFKKRLEEAERVAARGISSIRQWLTYHCTDEKLMKLMTITEAFRKGRDKCGDPDYLSISIMLLETACYSRPPYAWKSSIHGLQDDLLDSIDQ
ncbi:uncharacterized protein LOC135848364 [Planococcus citri]|uniref:uncharacterized protein LOC135848364 n=1 Tax=Planococcus citri TaxID=170843 RepID=UPI0031F8CDE4